MNAQKITQTFNGLKQWQISGNYFKLLSAQYPVTVELFYLGQKVLSAPLMEAGFYQSILYDRVEVTTPLSEEISFLVAPSKGGSDRLAGEVAIVDGEKARTIAGVTFFTPAVQGAVAGELSSIQLYNPVGSGKRIVIESMAFASPTAGGIYFGLVNAACTGLYQNSKSKLSDGADGAGEGRIQTSVGGLAGTDRFGLLSVVANVPDKVSMRKPVVLTEGWGMFAEHGAANATAWAFWESIEEYV